MKIPTLEELKKKVERENPIIGDNYVIDEVLVNEVLNLLHEFPDFYRFLLKISYNHIELPTSTFWELIYYFKTCIEEKNVIEIKNILDYINKLVIYGDWEVVNLVCVWFLENLDNHRDILKYVFEIFKPELKELFLEYYWHYMEN